MRYTIVASTLAILIALGLVVPPSSHPVAAEQAMVVAAGPRLTTSDGHPFFLLGANYVGGPDRSWTMWQDSLFDPAYVDTHFMRAKSAGLNTVRVFVRPPLNQELAAGRWNKLDTVVATAEKHGLYLIITLYDYRDDDLARVAALDKAIASRYANRNAVLAYDLKNEPHYQDLAITVYPDGPAPLQTDRLIKQYGERLNQQQANEWRQSEDGKARVPARFSEHEAYLYVNNYRIYLEFHSDAGKWVADHDYSTTTLDYMDSPDSAKWKPLIDVMNETLAAWLKPRIDAIRSVDSTRVITVGYSDLMLARLSANTALTAISVHRFPNVSLKALQDMFKLLDYFRQVYPDKPLILEEFGYSNATTDSAATSPYETALALYALSHGYAGAAKWSLYDVATGFNPREMNYGLFRTDGGAKEIVTAMRAIGDYVRSGAPPAGQLVTDADPSGAGLRLIYTAPDALFVAAKSYADPNGRLSFESAIPAQVFVSWTRRNSVDITTTAAATVRLDPGALLGVEGIDDWVLQRSDGSQVSLQRDGAKVIFASTAGQSYRLKTDSVAVDARIEIVWPHGNLPVTQAKKANIGAFLFEQGTGTTVCPQVKPTVHLWRALNNGIEQEVSVGTPRAANVNGVSFNVWDFNDIDVSAATDPNNKYYFRLSVDGMVGRSSVWSHAADARTYLPNPDVPTAVASAAPTQVDAKVEIVWPHGNLPVSEATKANIGVYIFQRGTLQSVPANWNPTVRLWRSINNGYEEPVAVGVKKSKTVNGVTFPTWEFNDVDVSAARDPLNKIYFRVTVDGVDSRGNIWAHGADARTHFPQQDVPTRGAACE